MANVRTSRLVRAAAGALSLAVVVEMALTISAGPALAQTAAATMAATMAPTMAAGTMAATMPATMAAGTMAATMAPTMAAGTMAATMAGTMAGTPSATPAAYNNTCPSGTAINLYAAIGYDSDTAKDFETKTGIHVNVVDDSTGNILAKISAEGINPQWDATWFDGDAAMQALDDQGFLLHFDVPNSANLTDLGLKVLPASHAYYPTGVTAASAIAYNTKKVTAADLPKDWNDLLDPKYKNLIAESNPAFSGPSYQHIASIAQIMGGLKQGEDYFTKLKANGLKLYDTAGPAVDAIVTGDRVYAVVQDAGVYADIFKGEPLALIYPTSGVGVLPSAIGVAANGQHQGCAEQFVNYVLSLDGQNAISQGDPGEGDRYYVPVVKGVQQVVKRQTTGINFVFLDIPTWAKASADYKAWFRDNIASGQ